MARVSCCLQNYRIERPNEDVRQRIARNEWKSLLPFDQLMIAQQTGAAFEEFSEAELAFQPTYKYDSGTSVYDSSEKQRVPSWTDRVLWKASALVVFCTLHPARCRLHAASCTLHPGLCTPCTGTTAFSGRQAH